MKIKLNNLMFDRLIEARVWLTANEHNKFSMEQKVNGSIMMSSVSLRSVASELGIPLGLLSQPDWATIRECSEETTVCAGEFNDLVRFIEAVELIRGVVAND